MKGLKLLDWVVIGFALVLLTLFVIIYRAPEKDLGTATTLTVTAPYIESVYNEAAKKEGPAFFNGQKIESKIVGIERKDEMMNLTIEGLGKKEAELMYFNGQRIVIGKKAEVHSGFLFQGSIIKFEVK